MRYFTWRLNWDDPRHGTGPEQAIAEQSGHAEASMFANPNVETGAILGYLFSGDVDTSLLSAWQVDEIDQAAALVFAQAIAPEAYLLPDGIITVPEPGV